jgi:hypothetical protein
MTSAGDEEHQRAAARHAKKRAARLKGKAGKKKPAEGKTPSKKKRPSPSRVRQRPLESTPLIGLTSSQSVEGESLFLTSPLPGLTAKELREVAELRKHAEADDNKAAEERPSQLTPKQLKRLAASEAKKAALSPSRRREIN